MIKEEKEGARKQRKKIEKGIITIIIIRFIYAGRVKAIRPSLPLNQLN